MDNVMRALRRMIKKKRDYERSLILAATWDELCWRGYIEAIHSPEAMEDPE